MYKKHGTNQKALEMKQLKFSDEMAIAIGEGRKTQTRRVVDPQPVFDEDSGYIYFGDEMLDLHDVDRLIELCPYGKVGDNFTVLKKTLKFKDIRIERLHDISEDDAKAEGVMDQFEKHGIPKSGSISWYAKNDFRHIWQSIYPEHPKKAWELNPYVWVIEFEKNTENK